MFAKCVYIILVKKNIQLSKGIGQFRARSGPILSDPVIRPDPVNTRTQIKANYSNKIEGRKFSHLLLAHQAQTNLPSVAVPGPSTPTAQLPALMSC